MKIPHNDAAWRFVSAMERAQRVDVQRRLLFITAAADPILDTGSCFIAENRELTSCYPQVKQCLRVRVYPLLEVISKDICSLLGHGCSPVCHRTVRQKPTRLQAQVLRIYLQTVVVARHVRKIFGTIDWAHDSLALCRVARIGLVAP